MMASAVSLTKGMAATTIAINELKKINFHILYVW